MSYQCLPRCLTEKMYPRENRNYRNKNGRVGRGDVPLDLGGCLSPGGRGVCLDAEPPEIWSTTHPTGRHTCIIMIFVKNE